MQKLALKIDTGAEGLDQPILSVNRETCEVANDNFKSVYITRTVNSRGHNSRRVYAKL